MHEALGQLIGLAEPPGEIVRVWRNDAANGTNSRHEIGVPEVTPNGSLSVAATDLTGVQSTPGPERYFGRRVSERSIPNIPAGHALMVVHLTGLSTANGNGFIFTRVSEDASGVAEGNRRLHNALLVRQHLMSNDENGNWLAFHLPAGRWVISDFTFLNLCLGGPAFTVTSGEVIYAGAFDLSAQNIGPDLSLDPARTWLSPHPDLAGRMRAAEYSNGWTVPCSGGSSVYALEFEDRTFRDGYHWGSQARIAH